MKRRSLFKTAPILMASCGLPTMARAQATSSQNEWDVVVVGAGFAGLCAALEAAEKGAKVVLIEKMNRPDGTTIYSS